MSALRSSGISAILRSIETLSEAIHSQGGTLASDALTVSRLSLSNPGETLCVLCASDDVASDFAADLESLSMLVDGKQRDVLHFPTWEQSPYSSIAPSLRVRLARVSALSRFMNASASPAAKTGSPAFQGVCVTTLAGLLQATLPKSVFLAQTISFRLNESSGSREDLLFRLASSGYQRVDTVEDPGTFAVRGDILDIYPPDRPQPVRLELFDDLIEKMRSFDASTQRAQEELGFLLVPPAREVLIHSKTLPLLRERLKNQADDAGIPRSIRDPILAMVQGGAYPDHSDIWAPFAYENTESLLDYLPKETRFVWVDELSCQQAFDGFMEEQKRRWKENKESLSPSPDHLFPRNPEIDRAISQSTRLYLDRITLAQLDSPGEQPSTEESSSAEAGPSSHLRTAVRPNTDLATPKTAGAKRSLSELEGKLKAWLDQGFRVLILASTESQLERIRFLLEERGLSAKIGTPLAPGSISLRQGSLSQGFRWPAENLVVLTEGEILGARHLRKQRRASGAESGSAAKDWSGLQALSDLQPGDAVVHVEHGIGRYLGLSRLDLSGAPSDFLLLEYANKDKLYLPVYRLNVIQKYAGSGDLVTLDKLGSQQFAKTKEKVREAVKKLAFDLVQLYAERKIQPGVRFSPRDALFREFEAKFPFDETPDQLKAIDDILGDLESGRSMDRLVCGDVGYGKTEVAIRAAFRAVSDGKQVAVLVPTTVLAFQHEQSFRSRIKDYPIQIESVSRFKTAKEQKAVLEQVKSGKTDIVIGTHRLLSRDVAFKDLGLVIVDEEHRFGVEHKEKLKTLKVNTHVLTLTATPIPRTLHMSLAGLRDISLINTPPVDRLPIRTYVSRQDDDLIRRAISFELARGGQVFFLHNRVQSIYEMASKIRELVPEALVSVGHGQMSEGELEEAMVGFYQKKSNVLVCTTIIESGLDIPSANTIIIGRADSLGLAQLYQIRGRVGRSQVRAYAYLLIPGEGAVTEDAKKRLEVIQRFVELGSGFSVASHDLEIRGGGDLLGPQQSGHIAAVGFDLYTELLEEAIREIQGKGGPAQPTAREPEIKAPFPAFLSEEYVPDVHQRLSLYRRFSAAAEDEALTQLEEELKDRFGPIPLEAQNLLWMIRIKQLLKRCGIDVLTVGPEKVSLAPGGASLMDPARAIALVSSRPKVYQLTPDSKFVAKIPTLTLRDLFFSLETLLRDLCPSLAAQS